MAGDHYTALGLSIDATPEEIRSAYFMAARRSHPDANPDAKTTEWFLRVQEAYDILGNPRRRAEYDASLPEGLMPQPAVAVHVSASRSTIPRMREPQLVYLLLDINCTADPAKASAVPAHLCFVVDRSTSMQGERIEVVKSNLLQVLHRLKPVDMVSVVSFSDRAEVVIPPTRVSALNKNESRIYSIQTGGGTEVYHGLSLGMNVIRGGPGDEGLRQVILLTDGHTYGDEQSCLALAEAAGQEGIGISALGIGHEWNDVFLDRLTGISGGSTQFVRSTRDLDGMLNKILAGAGMMYARRVRLEYREDEHLALRYAMRLQPDVTSLPLQSPLVLGNLQRGKGISLLMEVVVSPAEDDIDMLQLLDGRLKMHVFDNGVRPARLFIDVRCPLDDSAAAEVPPPKLMEAVARMTLYRMQENARKQVEAGEADKAARQLQFLATNLLSRGNREFAHSVLAEAEHIRQSRVFSKDGDKHMKYGTRALLLPSGMEPRS